MNESRDRPHTLVVTEYEGEREYEIEHPGCARHVIDTDPSGMDWLEPSCMTASIFYEGDFIKEDWVVALPIGRHTIQAWATPAGWAGSNPIDPDAGIDLLPDGER